MTQHNEVETLNNDMTIIPARDKAVQIYSQPCGLDPYLKHIREEIDRFRPNTGTAKGRSEIASMAHKVARSKTALDGLGKELVAELKEMPRKIDAERKRMRDTLDQWKEEVRQPLTEWEQAEAARVNRHEDALAEIAVPQHVLVGLTADDIRERLITVKAVRIGPEWEEFEAQAARAKDTAISTLEAALERHLQWEAEQAELARLRQEAAEREQRERDERIAREAEERARKAAEDAARKEREEYERQAREAKDAEERAKRAAEESERRRIEYEHQAENERLAAIKREKQAAERARQEEIARAEAKRQKEAAELAKREADRKHKARINREAVADLVTAGLTEDQAKAAVTAIAKGAVRNTRMMY